MQNTLFNSYLPVLRSVLINLLIFLLFYKDSISYMLLYETTIQRNKFFATYDFITYDFIKIKELTFTW